MLANGQGKTRMTKNLTNRKPKTWQLLFLSSGELGMGACIAQAGIVLKGGQEVRLADIPAEPSGSQFGAFESIHNFESAKQFAEHLNRATQSYHGTLLDAYLSKLVTDRATNPAFASTLKKQVYAIARKLAEGTIDTAVSRVANRFALVQVALELAHAYGLLPFPLEHIGWAIGKIFRDWLDYRGGDGSIEVKNACDRIHSLLVSNEFSDRVYDLSAPHRVTVRNLLAYRKSNSDCQTEEFWVPSTVFDKELCAGVDKSALIKELQQRGWLAPPRSDGKSMHTRSLNGKRSYFYIFSPDKFPDAAEDEKVGVQGVQGVQVSPNINTELDCTSLVPVHLSKSLSVHGVQSHDEVTDLQQPRTPRTPPVHQGFGTGTLGKNGSQLIVKDSSTPRTPCTPEKTQSKKIVENDLLPMVKAGDKVIVQTSQAVGVTINRRTKNYQSPKKGVVMVNQYLVEFEGGDRTWLDADVLVLAE
jgi:hypothetical protein